MFFKFLRRSRNFIILACDPNSPTWDKQWKIQFLKHGSPPSAAQGLFQRKWAIGRSSVSENRSEHLTRHLASEQLEDSRLSLWTEPDNSVSRAWLWVGGHYLGLFWLDCFSIGAGDYMISLGLLFCHWWCETICFWNCLDKLQFLLLMYYGITWDWSKRMGRSTELLFCC